MKKLTIVILFVCPFLTPLFAQEIEQLHLKVIDIVELKDCYIINTVNENSKDTIPLISVKGKMTTNNGYKKIRIGHEYFFKYENLASEMAAMPPEKFVLGIKSTIAWQKSDGRRFPFLGKNTIGLYIHN